MNNIILLNTSGQVNDLAAAGSIVLPVSGGGVSFTSAIKPSYPAGVVGITTGAAVTAGSIGETISNTTTSGSLVAGNQTSVGSISLSPGLWEITGATYFAAGASTVTADISSGISSVNNSLPSLLGYYFANNIPNTAFQGVVTIPIMNVNISSTTTYYCVVRVNFTVSTYTAQCKIEAVRRS